MATPHLFSITADKILQQDGAGGPFPPPPPPPPPPASLAPLPPATAYLHKWFSLIKETRTDIPTKLVAHFGQQMHSIDWRKYGSLDLLEHLDVVSISNVLPSITPYFGHRRLHLLHAMEDTGESYDLLIWAVLLYHW